MTIEGSIKNEKDQVAKECYKMMKNMYKNEFSEILTFFYGIHVSNIVSIKNNKILSSCPEPFMNISLSIPNINNPNIYNCFDEYLEEEILKDDNAWFNDKTNSKENVIKKFRIWSLPKIMIIDFKRFTNNLDKDNRYITFPINNLDMRKYIDGYNSADYIYDLFGICNHLGGTKGGHYNSYIKNLNGKWYLYDDTEVLEMTDVENLVTANAYCLFYRKKT
jgi:ubiquitin C-terminal hydrolase